MGIAIGTHIRFSVLVQYEAVRGKVSVGRDGSGQALGYHTSVVFFAAVCIVDSSEIIRSWRVPRANLLVRDRFHCVFQTLRSADRGPRIRFRESFGVIKHHRVVVERHVGIGACINGELV